MNSGNGGGQPAQRQNAVRKSLSLPMYQTRSPKALIELIELSHRAITNFEGSVSRVESLDNDSSIGSSSSSNLSDDGSTSAIACNGNTALVVGPIVKKMVAVLESESNKTPVTLTNCQTLAGSNEVLGVFGIASKLDSLPCSSKGKAGGSNVPSPAKKPRHK